MFKVQFPKANPTYTLCSPSRDDYILNLVADLDSFYEGGLLDLCATLPLPDGLAIDVGANIGNHTLFFAAKMGREVIAFEPSEYIAEALRQTVEENGLQVSVNIEEIGLSNESAKARIAVHFSNLGMTRLIEHIEDAERHHYGEDKQIMLISLDDYMSENSDLDAPALIKIDVEGHEMAVLEGARETLETHRPLLLVEQHDPSQLITSDTFLRGLGYRLLGLEGRSKTYVFCDAERYAIYSEYISSLQIFRQSRSAMATRRMSLVEQEKSEKMSAEIDRLRTLNSSVYKRLANAETKAAQAKAELGAAGLAPKVPSVEARARDLQAYKGFFTKANSDVATWRERAVTLDDTIKKVGVKYKMVTQQVTDGRAKIAELETELSALKKELAAAKRGTRSRAARSTAKKPAAKPKAKTTQAKTTQARTTKAAAKSTKAKSTKAKATTKTKATTKPKSRS